MVLSVDGCYLKLSSAKSLIDACHAELEGALRLADLAGLEVEVEGVIMDGGLIDHHVEVER